MPGLFPTLAEEIAPYFQTVAGAAPLPYLRSPAASFMNVVSDGTFYPTGPDSGMARYLNRPLPFDGNNTAPAGSVLPEYDKLLQEAAAEYNVPINLARAVMMVESNGGRDLRTSSAGARGPMQLMPATARYLGVKNIDNPYENVRGGVKYLREMLNRFNDDWNLAMAGYNAGPGRARRALREFDETRNYISKANSILRKWGM